MMERTVLIVEDEHPIRDIMMWILDKDRFNVIPVETAEEGLERVAEADLILLNLKLPGMSGEEFLKEVRYRGHSAPAIIVTATQLGKDWKERMEKMGIVFFVEKPFSAKLLLEMVNRACGVNEKIEDIEDSTKKLQEWAIRQEQRKEA